MIILLGGITQTSISKKTPKNLIIIYTKNKPVVTRRFLLLDWKEYFFCCLPNLYMSYLIFFFSVFLYLICTAVVR